MGDPLFACMIGELVGLSTEKGMGFVEKAVFMFSINSSQKLLSTQARSPNESSMNAFEIVILI